MLTIGQYLAPSNHHLPVRRYVPPDAFARFEAEAGRMGFTHAAVGALVRSSYHADRQAHAAGVGESGSPALPPGPVQPSPSASSLSSSACSAPKSGSPT
jgi:lipoic acid synthetase